MHQSLCSEYTRITLLHKQKKEKVTLDFNLSFFEKQQFIQYNNLVIAEVKADNISTIHFYTIMKKSCLILLVFGGVLFAQQQKRLSDTELMLMVLNNNNTRAILRDSTLFVYVIKGNSTLSSFRECADIANANRLVVVTQKGIQEEKLKKTK